MYTWIIGYIVFVIAILVTIYFTVYTTYVQLHKNEERFEGFVAGDAKSKCVVYSSDNVPHPWDDAVKWGDACKSHDIDKAVACVEVLTNIGGASKVEEIPVSNTQRVYLPIGASNSLRLEVSNDKHDVYPKHIWMKRGYQVTLISSDKNVSKRFTEHAQLMSNEIVQFKNGSVEVKALDKEAADANESTARDFVLKGKLKSKNNSNFCMTVKKNSKDVIASECTPDYKEQEWLRDEHNRLVSVANDTCLVVREDNSIGQETCDKVPRQTWSSDSLHRLLAKNSPSMCMQPNGESVVEGATYVMRDCTKDIIQQWVL